MKALPKRKGNANFPRRVTGCTDSLNESPSEKEGKYPEIHLKIHPKIQASMKALPKRKGNLFRGNGRVVLNRGLNESPSEKEGKSSAHYQEAH